MYGFVWELCAARLLPCVLLCVVLQRGTTVLCVKCEQHSWNRVNSVCSVFASGISLNYYHKTQLQNQRNCAQAQENDTMNYYQVQVSDLPNRHYLNVKNINEIKYIASTLEASC